MGLQELILKERKELEYLDEVVNDQDLIVLELEQASPSRRSLPEDIGGQRRCETLEHQSTGFRRMPGISGPPTVFGGSFHRHQGVLVVENVFRNCQIRVDERAPFGTCAQQKVELRIYELPSTNLAFNNRSSKLGWPSRTVEDPCRAS
ncbi:hypothetical protein MRX96_058221 [Rhipicephalus microplus]